jgi:hypothetical protein
MKVGLAILLYGLHSKAWVDRITIFKIIRNLAHYV